MVSINCLHSFLLGFSFDFYFFLSWPTEVLNHGGSRLVGRQAGTGSYPVLSVSKSF